jgi:aspartate carbamoyltransferase catalytic subunit
MQQTLSVKNLISIKELNNSDLRLILDTSKTFKDILNRPVKKVPSLRDYTIANVFFENSTRTKLSFELAQKRLGADVINFAIGNIIFIFNN